MWAEMERSPALGAPSSNNYGNDGRSTGPIGGIPEEICSLVSRLSRSTGGVMPRNHPCWIDRGWG